jgi:hypothetical protein
MSIRTTVTPSSTDLTPSPSRNESLTPSLRRTASPTITSIIEQLKNTGAVTSTSGLQLIALARNTLRLDYNTRADFRVERSGRTLFYLTVGRNLSDLRSRTTGIARACPDIAGRPLFWHRLDGWDYFGTEYFEGERLEALLLNGRISPIKAETAISNIVESLEKSFRVSSTTGVQRELRNFFDQAAALPVFGEIDRVVLEGVIFPFIEAGVMSRPPKTRWTNGDLIARNVLITPRGEAKLVDAEFASRSHFYVADAWRWRRFSNLSPELRQPATLAHDQGEARWLDAFCLLQHMNIFSSSRASSVRRKPKMRTRASLCDRKSACRISRTSFVSKDGSSAPGARIDRAAAEPNCSTVLVRHR